MIGYTRQKQHARGHTKQRSLFCRCNDEIALLSRSAAVSDSNILYERGCKGTCSCVRGGEESGKEEKQEAETNEANADKRKNTGRTTRARLQHRLHLLVLLAQVRVQEVLRVVVELREVPFFSPVSFAFCVLTFGLLVFSRLL
jgi:hypothetical protein